VASPRPPAAPRPAAPPLLPKTGDPLAETGTWLPWTLLGLLLLAAVGGGWWYRRRTPTVVALPDPAPVPPPPAATSTAAEHHPEPLAVAGTPRLGPPLPPPCAPGPLPPRADVDRTQPLRSAGGDA
jgi:hypothetical protein